MIYLIEHLIWFLIFTAACAAVAGAAWHSMRAQNRLDKLSDDRDRLMRDLVSGGIENSAGSAPSPELERQMDALRLRADMAQSRATESDRAAETARARAEEAAGRVAELERVLERAGGSNMEELLRLREQVAAQEAASRQVLDVEAAPAEPARDDESATQGWRLRYFEQRVRYLEGQARGAGPSPPAASTSESTAPMEWRARLAEARAQHLEQELRAAPAASPPQADALRWRVSYLEKRLQYLSAPAEQQTASPHEMDDDAERAKWRARYLESRVRYLESQTAAPSTAPASAPVASAIVAPAVEPTAADAEAPPVAAAPLVPSGAEERPPALPAAQSGAPDDLSLIEGISLLQQSTLNALGIYHFEQIAAWAPANIEWVDQYLRLRGRIVSENWVAQAERLAHEGPEAIRALEDQST